MDNKEAIALEGGNEQQPDRALALIGTMVQAFTTSQAESARAQADTVRAQGLTQIELARISAAQDTMHAKHTFRLQLMGGLVGAAVIIGAFLTGHFELISYALAAVVGAFAGYGLGRKAR